MLAANTRRTARRQQRATSAGQIRFPNFKKQERKNTVLPRFAGRKRGAAPK
jgi:hypothetical protein